jgi:RNase H-like domain found in reverse transcriptase/Reverse transcriptase (RNA-dependent DNA polymerase)/Integrase zinc binding domain/Integrase core domain
VRFERENSECRRDVRFIEELVNSVTDEYRCHALQLCGLGVQPEDPCSPITDGTGVDSVHSRAIRCALGQYTRRMSQFEGQLPPSRGDYDHQITLRDPDTTPVKRKAIGLNAKQQQELKKTLEELLKGGLIRKSSSPWAAPVFFVAKDGGAALRMVVDYRWLNEKIKRNSTSLPRFDELMARLSKARVFSKLDLRSGYHQVRVRESDVELTAFTTPFGHYEWLVMPFGETNAPATFVQLMTQLVLTDCVNRFVLGFVDDILIYSETEEEHVEHVRTVLQQLERHRLFIKPAKCKWMVTDVEFLGHRIRAGPAGTEITATHDKVEAVRQWPVPRTVTDVRSFLGFVNYYREHIDNFAHIAVPLTDLTKSSETGKRAPVVWTHTEQRAFEALKQALCEAPALVIVDDDKPFVMHTDASDFAIGAVLSQHDANGKLRPVGYMSRKLSGSQLNWSVYEKELFAVISALQHWTMHLMGTAEKVVIFTDHATLQYLLRQPKLTARQSRWSALLSSFNIELRYIKGEANSAADALSRRPDHDDGAEQRRLTMSSIAKSQLLGGLAQTAATINAVQVESTIDPLVILEEIRQGYSADEECEKLMASPEQHRYVLRDGLLLRHGDSGIYVPRLPRLRTALIRETHDADTSGHMGVLKTHERLAQDFYWPRMRKDVNDYVASCRKCLANKPSNAKPAGLLVPIEPQCKGHTVTMDFIGPLPRTGRNKNYILVMVDKFTKRAWYVATKQTVSGREVADLFFDTIVRHQGLPQTIISDRDPRFTGSFWRALWERCGTKLAMSTAYHPQSDGQTERQNRTLEETLRSYVNERGSDWDLHLAAAEIAYNSSVHAVTKQTPFKLDGGIDARLPINFVARGVGSVVSMDADQFLALHERNYMDAIGRMDSEQQRQAAYANRHRREEQYAVGDKAWLSITNLRIRTRGSTKLLPRFLGPFDVTRVIGDVNVELQLPEHWSIHPRFHVSKLKKHRENDDERFPNRQEMDELIPSIVIEDEEHEQLADYADYEEFEDGALFSDADSGEKEQASSAQQLDSVEKEQVSGAQPDSAALGMERPTDSVRPPHDHDREHVPVAPAALPARTTRARARQKWDNGERHDIAELRAAQGVWAENRIVEQGVSL